MEGDHHLNFCKSAVIVLACIVVEQNDPMGELAFYKITLATDKNQRSNLYSVYKVPVYGNAHQHTFAKQRR